MRLEHAASVADRFGIAAGLEFGDRKIHSQRDIAGVALEQLAVNLRRFFRPAGASLLGRLAQEHGGVADLRRRRQDGGGAEGERKDAERNSHGGC